MKCPHCGYEKGWSGKELGEVNQFGEDFVRLYGILKVDDETAKEEASIYACPKCRIVFMNDW